MKTLTDNQLFDIKDLFASLYGDVHLWGVGGAVPNERRAAVLADLTSPDATTGAAKIDGGCRKALAALDAEEAQAQVAAEKAKADLRSAQAAIADFRERINQVVLADPRKAKELADNRDAAELRQEALVRLVAEAAARVEAIQARRTPVVEAAIEAERALWESESTRHVEAIEKLAAELFNRSEAIRAAGQNRYEASLHLSPLLAPATAAPEPALPLVTEGTGWGVGLGEAMTETLRRGV